MLSVTCEFSAALPFEQVTCNDYNLKLLCGELMSGFGKLTIWELIFGS